MSRQGAVVVFPGQGILDRAPYRTGDLRTRLREVIGEMSATGDAAAAIADGAASNPEALSLFIFAASVAHYRTLQGFGLNPAALIGHGFGELIALVCGGAFSIAEGADLVVHRTAALERTRAERGRMIAVHTTLAVAERLVDTIGRDRIAVAAENSRTEIVLSGTTAGIDAVVSAARKQAIAVRLLTARWPLHCRRAMDRAAADLAARLRHVRAASLHTPVFSPIVGRFYDDSDDYADCLPRHLTSAVRFADAVETLWADGIRMFLSCGPLRGIDGCIADLVRTVGTRPPQKPRVDFPEQAPECRALAS
jgi:acyl transferase domain-containing protein